PYILHQRGVRYAARVGVIGVELRRASRLVKVLVRVERIEIRGGIRVDISGDKLPVHEFLWRRVPRATPDEVLAQGHAQHATCHAVDREMDSRYDTVGREACRLA